MYKSAAQRSAQVTRHISSRNTRKMSTDTSTYKLNHSVITAVTNFRDNLTAKMIRIKDPKTTLPFYEKNFGMKVLHKAEQKEAKFDLYFLAFDSAGALNAGKKRSDRQGILELTHNYGSEDKSGQVYTDGNKDPQGFGHICFSVDNISVACKALEENGVKFQKKLTDGRQKDIAFALDPDGYWIELVQHGQNKIDGKSDISSYRFNHTMVRVKDPKASLRFYTDILGMQLLYKAEMPAAKFDLYFLGYASQTQGTKADDIKDVIGHEGVLELTHNYGSEEKEGQVYTNGNDTEFNGKEVKQGYGHIAISVDNIDAACSRFDEKGVNWKKKLTDGRMRNIAFVLDPDNCEDTFTHRS